VSVQNKSKKHIPVLEFTEGMIVLAKYNNKELIQSTVTVIAGDSVYCRNHEHFFSGWVRKEDVYQHEQLE
jgi:desulfoferrodoxin (superoxide reductase-like protein)